MDPEAAFVAALSSCHMLTFLTIAAKKLIVIDSYDDHAVGHMEKNDAGRRAITRVVLQPEIGFAGDEANVDTLEEMHHLAHEQCFISNSVTTEVTVEPA